MPDKNNITLLKTHIFLKVVTKEGTTLPTLIDVITSAVPSVTWKAVANIKRVPTIRAARRNNLPFCI